MRFSFFFASAKSAHCKSRLGWQERFASSESRSCFYCTRTLVTRWITITLWSLFTKAFTFSTLLSYNAARGWLIDWSPLPPLDRHQTRCWDSAGAKLFLRPLDSDGCWFQLWKQTCWKSCSFLCQRTHCRGAGEDFEPWAWLPDKVWRCLAIFYTGANCCFKIFILLLSYFSDAVVARPARFGKRWEERIYLPPMLRRAVFWGPANEQKQRVTGSLNRIWQPTKIFTMETP